MVRSEAVDELVAELQELLGEDLRSVHTYDEHVLTPHFFRNDVTPKLAGKYEEEGHRRILERTIEVDNFNSSFERATIQAQMTWFEDSMLFIFFRFPYAGLLVDIESEADPALPALKRLCLAWLAERSSLDQPPDDEWPLEG